MSTIVSPRNYETLSLLAGCSEAVAETDSVEEANQTQIHELSETFQVVDGDINSLGLSENHNSKDGGGAYHSTSHSVVEAEPTVQSEPTVGILNPNHIDFGNPDKGNACIQLAPVLENGTVHHQLSKSENGHFLLPSEPACGNNLVMQECLDHGDDGLAAGSKKRSVAVTGAGGFIASWIVKLLLQRGFYVRGTLRNMDDENTAHLRSLEGASERLELLRADILHLPSLVGVVEGCEGVFHTACPVLPAISDPEAQMLGPAVEGTLNVMRACAQAQVKRVVMTSSIGAVYMNPKSSPEQVFDESCWSDENYLKDIKEWYCLAKLRAERTAWDYARTHDMDLVTICPAVTLGTMLQPRINQSSNHILKYLNGSTKTYANLCQAYVDVEDAAEAHVLAFVTPTARGRYLCCKWSRHRGEVVDALARMYPHYPIPTRCKDDVQLRKVPLRFCNQKVEQLGLHFTSFDRTLRHAVSSLQATGILPMSPTTVLNLDDDQCGLDAHSSAGTLKAAEDDFTKISHGRGILHRMAPRAAGFMLDKVPSPLEHLRNKVPSTFTHDWRALFGKCPRGGALPYT